MNTAPDGRLDAHTVLVSLHANASCSSTDKVSDPSITYLYYLHKIDILCIIRHCPEKATSRGSEIKMTLRPFVYYIIQVIWLAYNTITYPALPPLQNSDQSTTAPAQPRPHTRRKHIHPSSLISRQPAISPTWIFNSHTPVVWLQVSDQRIQYLMPINLLLT